MIKLKPQLIIYILGILSLSAGCISDDAESGDNARALTLTLQLDELVSESATRAPVSPVEGETQVQSLYLLFFAASEDMSGTLQKVVPLTSELNMGTSYVISGSSEISADGAYHIWGIGNLNGYVNDTSEWLAQWEGVTEAFFRSNAVVELSGYNDESDYTNHAIKMNELLMSGYVEKEKGVKNIQMLLTRNTCRVDVKNIDTASTLKTISIWNSFAASSITGDKPFDFSQEGSYHQRFYGITCSGQNINGGLYTFENYRNKTAINDKTTTCLIVGLQIHGQTEPRYYRVNISLEGNDQRLKRNYAYCITILSVTSVGYATESEAWEGSGSELNYLVNSWNLDDNGLIISDEFSILAMPVKTIKIGSKGGEYSYSITTFSTLDNPSPLSIKSQMYEPEGNISAQIRNGNLVINALPMNTGEAQRSGAITVTFAGLESTVNILQSPSADVYLEVTLDDQWQEQLAPTIYSMSEYIYINASGPYTIELFGDTEYFGIKNMVGEYVTKISSSELSNDRFRICTIKPNNSTAKVNKAFAMVTLNEAPDTYVSVVTVQQAVIGGIKTTPKNLSKLAFFGNGQLDSENSVADEGVTSNTFTISSASAITYALSGANSDRFKVTYENNSDKFTVTPTGINTSGNNYFAILSIANVKNGFTLIDLIQYSMGVSVNISADTVDAKGADLNFSWSVEGIPTTTAMFEVITKNKVTGKAIPGHQAYIKSTLGDKIADGTFTSETNLQLHVPKIYYVNNNIDVTIEVNVTTAAEGLKASFIKEQTELIPMQSLSALASGSGYGSIGNNGTYFAAFKERFKKEITTTINSYASGTNNYGTNNFINFNNNNAANSPLMNSGYNWGIMKEWINGDYGILMIVGDYITGQTNFINNMNSSSSVFGDFTVANNRAGSNNPSVDVSLNTRVYQFIMAHSLSAISNASGFSMDGTHTEVSAWPVEATAIIKSANNSARAIMTIDPKRRTIYIGEGQMFDSVSGNQQLFMNNVIEYIRLGMLYGSHFTDMLIDKDYQEGDYVAPPWDAVWGEHAIP